MKWLRQSTTTTIKLGPFVIFGENITVATNLTPTVKLAKNGGAIHGRSSVTPVIHDSDGYYTVELDPDDTSLPGLLKILSADPGTLPLWDDFLVVPAKIYDSLIIGSDNLDVALTPSGIDSVEIEADVNARQALVAVLAASAGTLSGSGSGVVNIQGGNVSIPRISATTDSAGNRTSVTLTLPA